MRLNHDCIRDIMITAVDNLTLTTPLTMEKLKALLPKYDKETLYYNCLKLYELGYIDASVTDVNGFIIKLVCAINDVTALGHEFTEQIRPERVYKEAKKKINSVIDSASMAVLSSVLQAITLKTLGL